MAKNVLLALIRRANLYVLDRSIPDFVPFGPPFGPALPALVTGSGPICMWTGSDQIVISAEFVSGGMQFAHLVNGAWVLKTPPTGARATAIHGTGPNDLWAVHGDTYSVSHYDGNTWVTDATLVTPGNVKDVFAYSATDVWVASNNGNWFRRSGAIGSGVWTNENATMRTETGIGDSPVDGLPRSVIAFGPNEVYWPTSENIAGNLYCYFVKWDGVVWTKSNLLVRAGMDGCISAPIPADSSQIWYGAAKGSGGYRVAFWDGATQVHQTGDLPNIAASAGDLVMTSPTLGYIIGIGNVGEIWRVWETTDGSTWAEIISTSPHEVSGSMGLGVWDIDLDPPVITPIDPLDGETDVAKDTPIVFTIVDDDSGVVLSTVRLWINDRLVFDGGDILSGWISTVVPITDGYKIIINHPNFDNGEVSARAYGEDVGELSAEESWSFSITRDIGMKIYPMIVGGVRKIDETEDR